MKREVCAVIVTYNRLELLKECISKIISQTYKCDIFVINNNSHDGTEEFLKANNISHFKTEKNQGGAGGFNLGIKICASLSYDYLWLMDDDCIARDDALEKLIISANKVDQSFGFIASKVLWINGKDHKMNEIKHSVYYKDDLYFIKQATFVSLLIKTEIVKKYGLPIKDFFIWGDDIEYTRRIAVRNSIPSYYAKDSIVVHKTKNNVGSKIAFDDINNLHRYYYAYRNESYLYRQENIKGILYYYLKCNYNILRIIIYSDNKKKRLRVMLKGIKDGLTFNPKVEYINE